MSIKITKTIISNYDDSETVIDYTYDNAVPAVSVFNSSLCAAQIDLDILHSLRRRSGRDKVDPIINFIGSFSTTLIDEEPEFHYFVTDGLNLTETSSFIVKARQSLYRGDVYVWTFGEIPKENEHIFDIKDNDIYYNELLELYYFSDFRENSADTFYEFVETKATYIQQKILMGD